MIFARKPREPRLEERLAAYWRERSAETPGSANERLGSLLEQLAVGFRAADDEQAGWFLDSEGRRVHVGLDPEGEFVSLIEVLGSVTTDGHGPELYAELLRANEAINGAHYGIRDLSAGRCGLLRAVVPTVGLDRGSLAMALESLLRQSHHSLGPSDPLPRGEHPLVGSLAARRRLGGEETREAALREGTLAVEGALAELSLAWHAEPDRAHDWRIETDLGILQAFLLHYGEALVARLAVEEPTEADSADFYGWFLEMSANGGAWFSVSDDPVAGRWAWAMTVVSAEVLAPEVLAFSLAEVLRHARLWIEA